MNVDAMLSSINQMKISWMHHDPVESIHGTEDVIRQLADAITRDSADKDAAPGFRAPPPIHSLYGVRVYTYTTPENATAGAWRHALEQRSKALLIEDVGESLSFKEINGKKFAEMADEFSVFKSSPGMGIIWP